MTETVDNEDETLYAGKIHPEMSLQDCNDLVHRVQRERDPTARRKAAKRRKLARLVLRFLPEREADEDQQQSIFHLMLLVNGGYSRCTNCGDPGLNINLDLESSCKIGHWLAHGSADKGQRVREPDSVLSDYPVHEYEIAIPHRIASREIQEAAADLVRVAHSAEMPCPTCGEVMRLDYNSDETDAIVAINEWLGRVYHSLAA